MGKTRFALIFAVVIATTHTVFGQPFTSTSDIITSLRNSAAAWGDYDNDGDLDLLIAGFDSGLVKRTKLYQNDGGQLGEISEGLPDVSWAALAWGDYDRDGYLDVVISGDITGTGITLVYRNNGAGGFVLTSVLAPYRNESVTWGDYDEDGDLDVLAGGQIYRFDGGTNFSSVNILIGGGLDALAWGDYDSDGDLDVLTDQYTTNGHTLSLYRNDGGTGFTNSGIFFPAIVRGDVAWGDYDDDGDPDLVLTGYASELGSEITRVYRNDGGTNFTDLNAGLPGLQESSAAWGDFDNDGDLDLLLTGGTGVNNLSTHSTRIYRNDGGVFVDTAAPLLNVAMGDGVCGDYDNDGDLDLFVTGIINSLGNPGSRLYRNDSLLPNSRPNPPTNVVVNVLGSSVTLTWPPAQDANQAAGLSYNVRLGTSPGLANLVGPMAHLTNGYRRLPAFGNVTRPQIWSMTNLVVGTYYVALQAADHTFAGSDFSVETSFTITQPWMSSISNQSTFPSQALVLPFTVAAPGTSLNTLTLSATASDTNALPLTAIVFSGSGSNRSVTITPAATASGTVLVALTVTDINGGFWTVPFNVVIESFTRIPTLLGETINDVAVPGDYDNDGFTDLFVSGLSATGRVSRLYRNLGSGTFTDSQIALPAIERGEAVVWGDFNNDNYLDLALGGPLGGTNVIQILRNNSANSFTRVAIIPTGTTYNSRTAWGDFDQDGDLDIVIAASGAALLYWNTGAESFTNSGQSLVAAGDYGAVAPADYDNDGDLDLLLSGSALANTWLYKNTGRGIFTIAATYFPRAAERGFAWGDYDQDGDLDVAFNGVPLQFVWGSQPYCHVYRNDGLGGFLVVATNLHGGSSGDLAWGDRDNDGDLDLLISASYWGPPHVYRNDGGHNFENIYADLDQMSYPRVYWADLENDGDLDIIASGNTNASVDTYATRLYRNRAGTSNSPPAAPGNLIATLLPENDVLLSWSAGSDPEATNGLSYNVRLGVTPGGIERITPEASLITGARRRAGLGNASTARQLVLRDLPRGTNYWSVQTLDAAFAGSPFAAEVSFVITNGRPALSPIADQSVAPNVSTPPIPFTVTDVETPATDLVVTATSSNPILLPNANISLGGTGTNRFLILTPLGVTNAATVITLVVTDGSGLSVTNSFRLTLEPFAATILGTSSAGGAVAWADYDNDGDLDLFLGGNPAGVLFQNNGGVLTNISAGIPGANYPTADWGDYDGDGDLDIMVASSGNFTQIYRNNGLGTFFNSSISLPTLFSPFVNWNDYDNDGDLDILLIGSTNNAVSGAGTRLYRKLSGPIPNQFGEVPTTLPSLLSGVAAWGDADNDGDQDLLLSGNISNNVAVTRVYRNDGQGTFTQAASLPSGNRSVAWGDYDNDGDLDALLGGTSVTRILRNDGGASFIEVVTNLPGVNDGVVAWGDHDNDGDLDILISGLGATGVYRNDGGNTFTNIGAGLTGLNFSRAAWADADGDGDLDCALFGSTNLAFGYIGQVLRNNFNPADTPPTAPSDLQTITTNGANNVLLTWGASADAQTTNAAGLNYNLRLGTANGAVNVMASHAAPSGFRHVPELGNAGPTNHWRLSNLGPGTYFWSVQAMDGAFAGSAFAAEATFVITNARPTISATTNRVMPQFTQIEVPFIVADADSAAADLVLSARSLNTNVVTDAGLTFVGAGTNRSLLIQSAQANGSAPITVTVTDPGGAFADTTFTVTVRQFSVVTYELLRAQGSTQAWADYDNDGDLDVLIAGATTNNCSYPYATRLHRNNGGGVFTNTGLVLPGIALASAAWADYDNDGDLDFIIAGQTNSLQSSSTTRLYRNQGSGAFALATNVFAGMAAGALAWGDYDNDGDADLLMVGRGTSSPFSTLYRNNGTNSFTALAAPMTGAVNCAVSWGDLDNDGDLDIVVTGGNLGVTLYRNNGNSTFSSVASVIPSFSNSAQALGDYDNDGDLDILVAGLSGSSITRIYSNLGNFNFGLGFNLAGVQLASVAWGDYDNDGWRDALIVGSSNAVSSRVYRNLGGTNFSEVNFGFAGTASGVAEWVDHDRDGDLDAMLVGEDGIYYCGGNGVLGTLYRNENTTANNPPTAPTNLASVVTGRNVVLSWAKSLDVETVRSNGLNYALRIGTNSGGSQILSTSASTSGFRQTTSSGLANTNRWRLQNLRVGTYYWSVQAIDPALAGSGFAEEAVFVITNTRPTVNSQVVIMAEDSARSITLTGSDPDGQTLTYNVAVTPTNGTLTGTPPSLVYRPKTNFFGGDSFAFQLFDGLTNSAPGSILLVVTQVQDVAVATLALQSFPGGQMQLRLHAEPYEQHRIEASQDLRVWTLLTNVMFSSPPWFFLDSEASNYTHRFYRSVWEQPAVTLTSPGQYTAGQFRLQLGGEIGRVYRVSVSTNLSDWGVLNNLVFTNTITPFTDGEAFKFDRRFYRFSLP